MSAPFAYARLGFLVLLGVLVRVALRLPVGLLLFLVPVAVRLRDGKAEGDGRLMAIITMPWPPAD